MTEDYPVGIRTFVLAAILSMLVLGSWEFAVRKMGYGPWLDDDKHLWAEQRAKLEHAGKDDVVLIGSSRVLFDIQVDSWQAVSGRKPIQLALPGSSPMPVLRDIVQRSKFSGTILIGVTPPLFFSPPVEQAPPWEWPLDRINNYYKHTYAERLGHLLSIPLQRSFAFLENDSDAFYNDLDLRTLVKRLASEDRVETNPPFPFFGYVDRDRNMTMLQRVTEDTAYAHMIQNVWAFYGKRFHMSPEETTQARDASIAMTKQLVDAYKARGGKVVFIRCPSSGPFLMGENMGNPRATFWDALLKETGCPGYYFEDYEFMNKYVPPEWSHLATPDAKLFTRDLVRQMQQDGNL